jgi:hypothetical protein
LTCIFHQIRRTNSLENFYLDVSFQFENLSTGSSGASPLSAAYEAQFQKIIASHFSPLLPLTTGSPKVNLIFIDQKAQQYQTKCLLQTKAVNPLLPSNPPVLNNKIPLPMAKVLTKKLRTKKRVRGNSTYVYISNIAHDIYRTTRLTALSRTSHLTRRDLSMTI